MKTRKQNKESRKPLISPREASSHMAYADHWDDGVAPKQNGIKRLNCSVNKQMLKDNLYAGYRPSSDRITRPVQITVEEGRTPRRSRSTNEPKERLEFTTSFLVGQSARRHVSPPKVRRVTPEKQHRMKSPERTKHMENTSNSWMVSGSPKRIPNPYVERNLAKRSFMSKQSPSRRSLDMDDFQSEKERARKDRWVKGVKRGWKDDGDLAAHFGEESTYGGTSYTESDGYSYSDDDMYSYESSRYGSRGRGYRNSGSKSRRHQQSTSQEMVPLFGEVSDDLGILAQMIISDGAACFAGAAEITSESIASCRTQDVRYA